MNLSYWTDLQNIIDGLEIDETKPYALSRSRWWNTTETHKFICGFSGNWDIALWSLIGENDLDQELRITMSSGKDKWVIDPIQPYFWMLQDGTWRIPDLVAMQKDPRYHDLPISIRNMICQKVDSSVANKRSFEVINEK